MEWAKGKWASFRLAFGERRRRVADYLNPETRVAEERAQNDKLRREIETIRRFDADRHSTEEALLQKENDETAAQRKEFEQKAQPLLDRNDKLSFAKLVYDEIVGQAESHLQDVHRRLSTETSGYGYQSKSLFVIGLLVEALRNQMLSGRPFAKELHDILEFASGSSDLQLISAPLVPFAEQGLKMHEHICIMSLETARLLREASAGPTTTASNLFEHVKFSDASEPPRNTSVDTVREHVAKFSADVAAKNYLAALQAADDALTQVPGDAPASEAAKNSLMRFKTAAVPVIMANQMMDYCDASINLMRYPFVEPFLSDIIQMHSK